MSQNEERDYFQDQINTLKSKLSESFVFKNFENDLLTKLEEKKIDVCFEEPFLTFRRNIQSLVSVVKLPIEMAFERSIKLIYDDIKRRHQIISLKDIIDDGDVDIYAEDYQHSREEKIIYHATSEFNSLIKREEGSIKFWCHSLSFVNSCAYESSTTADFLNACKELVNQATLLTWSALEIFMRDFFIIYLNKNPDKIEALSTVPLLKQKFDLKNIGTDQLLKYNFDLSGHMGDILIGNFDFSNIDLIKSIYGSLFNDPDLNKVLKSNSIWKLYQNRNLIVHKGGMVDQKYSTNTDTQLNVGEKLFIKPAEFQDYFSSIVEAVIATAFITDQKIK